MDVATTNSFQNAVYVFPGDGDGTLRFHGSAATLTRPRNLVAADLDRDGRLDLR